jgi:hypothetical protein
MSLAPHLRRLIALMVVAGGVLVWLAAHAEVLFADGLRYIRHAQQIERGDVAGGLFRAMDHPLYPLEIVAVHKVLGGEGPLAWQRAAQVASILAAVLLTIPLYLISLELFGPKSAWLGVAVTFLVPVPTHVFADALSESTFLLFWCWSLWGALKFLRRGSFGWLVPLILSGVLAYLTRPEGLLLPAALVATLALMPLLRSTRLNWPRWWAAVAFLVIGPAIVVGPYAWTKGGLGSKPAIARILGTMPKAPPDAVERSRVLDPDQSPGRTYAIAFKMVFESIRDAVTVPVLLLAGLGVVLNRREPEPVPRARLFLGVMVAGTLLALVRLHATSGYCTPRHTLAISLLLFPAAAAGFLGLMGLVKIPGRWVGLGEERFIPGPAVWALLIGGFLASIWTSTFAPLNWEFQAYREAGRFLSEIIPPDDKVVDFSGWALFYGERQGYTFRQLADLPGNPQVRWVVARESHLKGPWGYSQVLRDLTAGLEPIRAYPETPRPGIARVLIFDRAPLVAARTPTSVPHH